MLTKYVLILHRQLFTLFASESIKTGVRASVVRISCCFHQLLDAGTLQLKELSLCMSFLFLLWRFYAI